MNRWSALSSSASVIELVCRRKVDGRKRSEMVPKLMVLINTISVYCERRITTTIIIRLISDDGEPAADESTYYSINTYIYLILMRSNFNYHNIERVINAEWLLNRRNLLLNSMLLCCVARHVLILCLW